MSTAVSTRAEDLLADLRERAHGIDLRIMQTLYVAENGRRIFQDSEESDVPHQLPLTAVVGSGM